MLYSRVHLYGVRIYGGFRLYGRGLPEQILFLLYKTNKWEAIWQVGLLAKTLIWRVGLGLSSKIVNIFRLNRPTLRLGDKSTNNAFYRRLSVWFCTWEYSLLGTVVARFHILSSSLLSWKS